MPQSPKGTGPSGTTEPLPTNTGTDEQKAAADNAEKLAAQTNEELERSRAKLREAEERYKKLKEEEKKRKEAAKKAKAAEKEKVLKEREAKQKEIEAADAKIAALEKKLHESKAWKDLEAAKEARAAIGPLPKVRKGGSSGSKPRGAGGLNGSELRTMRAIRSAGKALTRKDLTEATGQTKGWSKLLGTKDGGNGLCGAGLLKLIEHEGEPMSYELTKAGAEALAKADAEAKE